MRLALLLLLLFSGAHTEDFRVARPGYEFQFPRDHGAHRDFRTEWWYFTGNVTGPAEEEFGFKLTFFRNGLVHPNECPDEDAPLALCDFTFAHFALTDLGNDRHGAWERVGREGLGLSHIAEDRFSARIADWSGQMNEDGTIQLFAQDGAAELSLTLTPTKPLVIHGQDGAHQKAANPDQASHYVTFPRMEVTGALRFGSDPISVTGLAWMDHEFASEQLSMAESGWAWFSIQLENGEELMLYHLRKTDGTYEPTALGSHIGADGTVTPLPAPTAYQIAETRHWTSPHSGGRYSVSWVITLPGEDARLEVNAAVDDQEMNMTRSSGLSYWEGATRITGIWRGEPVRGAGYTELVGYAPRPTP